MQATFCGTPAYAAPEMILGEEYSGGWVDVWSAGVVLFMMVTGRFPFNSVSSIISCIPDLSPVTNADLRDLLARIFVRVPSGRITISALTAHRWLVRGLTSCCNLDAIHGIVGSGYRNNHIWAPTKGWC
jgi:serine/threonine protein kinase